MYFANVTINNLIGKQKYQEPMDPRLYHYERRTPRLNNPTFKSEFVTDSLHVFKGGPLDSSSNHISKITQSQFKQTLDGKNLPYHPPEISKIRSVFENNRSKVPLSNLSSYARQIMFPTQRIVPQSQGTNKTNPEKFIKPELFLDNKEQNYIKTICKMNNEFLTNSRLNKSVDLTLKEAVGKPSVLYDDKDKRYYRYKHSYHDEIERNQSQINYSKSLNKPFVPSRLNYVDELKGII